MRKILFALVIMASSCSPSLNQVINSKHLAEACATKYPVKDSIGNPVIDYRPADNKDYTNQIDSLNGAIYALSLQMSADRQDTSIFSDIPIGYFQTVDSLISLSKKLKDQYKPCKPDTVKKEIPIYRRDTAAEEVQRQRYEAYRDKYVKAQADADRWEIIASKALWSAGILTVLLIALVWIYKGSIFSIFTSLFKRKS